MNQIPAGWYDDPENATQLRYWDGTAWSEHRSPKHLRPALKNQGPGAPVNYGFELFRKVWVQLLILAGIVLIFLVGAVIAAFVAVEVALQPGLIDIIDRVTDADYNPDFDPVDQAFEDSIEWTWSIGSIALLILAGLLALVPQWIAISTGVVHTASISKGHERTLGDAARYVFRNVIRWIGIILLWAVVYAAVVIVTVLLYVVAAEFANALFFLLIPATIGGIVFVWPYLQMAPTALALSPQTQPPFRYTVGILKGRWGFAAGRIFLVNLTLIGVNIGLSIAGIIPILGIVVAIGGNFVLTALQITMSVALYEAIEGELDPELETVTPSTPGVVS
ncbi:MAG: DUF2510 domain-containing protein [Actinomycetota bacterium]